MTKPAILLIAAGTVGLLSASALAGTGKKHRELKPTTLASAEKASVVKPIEMPAAPALLPVAPVTETAPSPELIVIPDLPADTSSALVPFPELENARPLIAPKPVKAAKTKAPVMNFGNDYTIGEKREQQAQVSRDVEHIVPKGLSQAQVATVIQSHMNEVQVCWNSVPKSHRPDACTADLKLSISESGQVTDIELGGDVPAAAHKCLTSAISHWSFPTAETNSDVEYGISLRSL